TDITLCLYNLSGQRVETLFDGRSKAGVHSTILNAGGLPSGLYFVKFDGAGETLTQKIMLIK
ncbi:MAG: T9SS type A sorting domain-containing protein, partial [Calditrichaeota bacterium]|nr:T9SS type A sorting domain-containing protein [Calditrichota bacterium]